MDSSPTYFDPQLLATVDGLRLRARHVVEGYVAGMHRSPLRGFSIEFSEHREYASGDDPRYLDWKVLGRTDKLYVKQFEDETNLIAHLMVDCSESMNYCGRDATLTKYDYAATLAVCLGWLVLKQQDATSLLTFGDAIQRHVRPATGGPHIREIVQVLEQPEFTGKTSMGAVLQELSERLERRGMVLLISDFFDDIESIAAGLRRLKHRRHDIVLIHLLDRSELEFPFRKPTRFLGLESSAPIVADPIALRSAYLDEFKHFIDQMSTMARSLGVPYHLLTTDTHFDVALRNIISGQPSQN